MGHSFFQLKKKGFTLIEILVVLAIIAILSVIGLQFLVEARKEGRDHIRAATIEQLALAFKLINDTEGTYPSSTGAGTEIKVIESPNAITQKVIALYPNFSNDPLEAASGVNYGYYYASNVTCSTPGQVVVFTRLESVGNSNVSQVCTGGTPTFPNSWPASEMYIMIVN